MDWPTHSVESLGAAFEPPFCPRPACPSHARGGFAWKIHGHFRWRDGTRITRFRCRTCRKTFSTQTFSCTYYLKRRELSVPIAAALQAGSAHRQIARSLGCAPNTVTRRAARLGRHALLLHAFALGHITQLGESLVYDDFEGFAYGQDFPFALGTAAGHGSSFLYDLDVALHPRRGRMSPAQKKRQKRLEAAGRRPRDGTSDSFGRWLDRLRARWPRATFRIVSDKNPRYRVVLAKRTDRQRFEHRAYVNPVRGPKGSARSPEARERDAAMFESDLLHMLVRHSSAHQRRETIAFGRRVNAVMERAFLFAVWRNFIKRRSERRPSPTPAMVLALADKAWSWQRVFAKRIFPWRQGLPAEWRTLYERAFFCPGPRRQARHELVNAA